MKVREFIDFLRQQDQEAIVQVVRGERSRHWNGDSYSVVTFDAELYLEYTDLRGNPGINEQHALYGKRFLLLGEAE